MGEIKLNYKLDTGLNDLVALFRANESTLFIASEFLISPGVQENLTRGSRFALALQEAEREIYKLGFDFWQPPGTLARMIETVGHAISMATDAEARAILLSLLRENDPTCIASVPLG